jgi:hypothetical protein
MYVSLGRHAQMDVLAAAARYLIFPRALQARQKRIYQVELGLRVWLPRASSLINGGATPDHYLRRPCDYVTSALLAAATRFAAYVFNRQQRQSDV